MRQYAIALLILLAGCAPDRQVVAPDDEAKGVKPGKPSNVRVYEAK